MSTEMMFEEIEAFTLKKVPEIRESYYEFGWDPIPYPTDEWLEKLGKIPLGDPRRLGSTILFESILTPFIMDLFEDETGNKNRIHEILDWIESLAHYEDPRIRDTLVGICICQAILVKIKNRVQLLRKIFSYFGEQTKAICQSHAKNLNLDPDVVKFLQG